MYIYNGKFNWFDYAKNECITVVFPGGFALNDPVSAFWQWTEDASGNKKHNTCQEGVINSVTKTSNTEYRIGFSFDYYSFDGTVSRDFSTLTMIMQKPNGERDPSGTMTLRLQSMDPVTVPSTIVYTGKLNWFEYADGEMVTLVVPAGVVNGAPVGMYFEWTVTAAGIYKENCRVNSTFRDVSSDQDGDISGSFNNGYYIFDFTVKHSKQECWLHMTNPSGAHDSNAPYDLKQTDFRSAGTKKALIVRFGTGTDNGIFLVRDMLTEHLAFSLNDIEMIYYDSEPASGPKLCTSGQDPPTISNFKNKFTSLMSSASPGNVRFLYVDAHGTTYPDEDHSGEADDNDEGWILAESNDGTRKGVISDDWVGQAIRGNLGSEVNLTILTSSCMGGGILDTHTATPGILLAGCHETQFNVKALKGYDPWMYAIVTVIKNQVKRKRGVPSYTVLYNEAKKFIKAQIANGQVSSKYQGPSPDETNPLPRDQDTNTSHQDPQLTFYSGYIDPGVERFLYPFVAPQGGKASGETTRYPKDEYPTHSEL